LPGDKDRPLRKFFKQDMEPSWEALITRSYVAIPEEPKDKRILGFISIMNAELSLSGTYDIPDKPGANRYPSQPAVRIARLAVSPDCRGWKIGRELVSLIFTICTDKICPIVGCRFLILNAKPDSVGFYAKQGFTLLDTEENNKSPNPVMWLDLKLYGEKDGSS
jgi:GNAT superfamily N-acetyltransferase